MHYIARHGKSSVAKAAILIAVPSLMVKTESNSSAKIRNDDIVRFDSPATTNATLLAA